MKSPWVDVSERWKTVEGYPLYAVSDCGRVKSFVRSRKGKLMKFRGAGGRHADYLAVDLGERNQVYVHALVAQAFIGPRPKDHDVNHKDGNKRNNRYWNLEYVTRKGNCDHARKLGLVPKKRKMISSFMRSKEKSKEAV